MKKILLLFIVACFTLTQLVAQESTFNKGDKVLNIGIGLGSTLYSGTYYKTTLPPISASLEFGVVDKVLDKGSIGVGPYVGFSSHKWDYSVDWYYTYTNIIIGARGVFHYPLVNKLDTYTGLLLGYDIVSAKEHGLGSGYLYNASGSTVAWSWFIGGRYYFSDNFAGMLELGYGIAYLNIGVALKF
jgi:hypothetical protein